MVDTQGALMQYYFVVNQFHGKEFYRVDNLEMKQITHHSDGTERFPQPLKIIPIPEYVAAIPLDALIEIYKDEFERQQFIICDEFNRGHDWEGFKSTNKLRLNIARVKLTQATP